MSDELKRFPPSDYKLLQLRKAGIIPFSNDLMSLAVLTGLFVAYYIFFNSFVEILLNYTRVAFNTTDDLSLKNGLHQELLHVYSDIMFKLLLVIILPIFLAAIFVGTYQTRFLFSIASIRFNIGRVFIGGTRVFEGYRQRFLLGVLGLLKAVICFAIGYLLLRYFLMELFLSSTIDKSSLIKLVLRPLSSDFAEGSLSVANHLVSTEPKSFENLLTNQIGIYRERFFYAWSTLLAISLVLGIISRICVVNLYYKTHQMTRSEIEAEERETEASPQLKQAVTNARHAVE